MIRAWGVLAWVALSLSVATEGCDKNVTKSAAKGSRSAVPIERLHIGVPRLRPGMTRREVLAVLGSPSFERAMGGKDDSDVVGHKLAYYISDPNRLNEGTSQWLAAYLDERGLLHYVGTNIDGLSIPLDLAVPK